MPHKSKGSFKSRKNCPNAAFTEVGNAGFALELCDKKYKSFLDGKFKACFDGKMGFERFFDDFAFVFDGIYDCLFAEQKGEKIAEEVGILYVFLTVIFLD